MATPSLSTKQINQITKSIKNWNNKYKFTWDTLVLHVHIQLNIKTTRQTLNSYSSIKRAYRDKKKLMRESKASHSQYEYVDTSASRVKNLENEIEHLQKQLDAQLTFIKRVAQQAQTNPKIMEVLQKTKQNL